MGQKMINSQLSHEYGATMTGKNTNMTLYMVSYGW
jgi:hypothetical protein